MKFRRLSFATLAAAMLLVIFPFHGAAQTIPIEKVIDSSDFFPGTTDPYFDLGRPSVDNGDLVLTAASFTQDGFKRGILQIVGDAVTLVVDTDTVIPNRTVTFTNVSSPSISNGEVAFFGQRIVSRNDRIDGLYANAGGPLRIVVETGMEVPGHPGELFSGVGSISLESGNMAFFGQSAVRRGIFTEVGGTLTKVVDNLTEIPPGDQGTFFNFRPPSLSDGNTWVIGIGRLQSEDQDTPVIQGIYTDEGGTLHAVADINSPHPDGSGTLFTRFDEVSVDGGNPAFIAESENLGTDTFKRGVYTVVDGVIQKVVDTNTEIPEGTGTFVRFDSLAFAAGKLVFVASGPLQKGIYVNSEGSLSKVLDLTDTLDGKNISFFQFSPQGFDGNTLAFLVIFTDNSKGIYRASLSTFNTEPGENVVVEPVDSTTGEPSIVTLTFDEVLEAGDTTVATSQTGPQPPAGLRLGNPPVFYDIDTTATFVGSVEVCIDYSGTTFGNESNLMLHHEVDGVWTDVTTSLDTVNDVICGSIKSFSLFAIFEIDIDVAGLQSPMAALAPEGETAVPPAKAFKQGRTLPLKLELFSAGVALTGLEVDPPQIMGLARTGATVDLETTDLDSGQANDNGLLFRFEEGSWIYNLSTRVLSAGTYELTLEVDDGRRYTAAFVLR